MMKPDSYFSPEQYLAQGFVDHVVAWGIERNAPPDALDLLRRVAYQVSIATSDGHVCAMLSDIPPSRTNMDEASMYSLLLTSGVVGTPDAPGASPLIMDSDCRIYLHRYFDYEHRLAHRLIGSKSRIEITDASSMKLLLDALFRSKPSPTPPDWQKIAAALALQQRLTIISGGPGTGKTATVVKLLACLLTQNPDCRIALTAPTGKAAARMQEAIRLRATDFPSELQSRLPTESSTIHRLLGVTPDAGKFRHHADNQLAIDALIVDEASMLDVALAANLFDAVPHQARIILLGDKDQLSAVEAGAVFSELSADPSLSSLGINELSALTGIAAEHITPPAPRRPTELHDSVIWFSENYRFATNSGIGKLATHINKGESELTLDWLRSASDPAICWIEDGNKTPGAFMMERAQQGYAEYLQAVRSNMGDKQAVFEAFERFRILCAVREGARGVTEINRKVSKHFRQSLHHAEDRNEQSNWYPGRPVVVSRNDYVLQLFNGDIGIALPDESRELMVFFPDSQNGYRAIAPIRLPEHETAFAMTVHKSQGSEFDSILLLLPANSSSAVSSAVSRIVSRELLYTAVTRSRSQATIAGSEAVLKQAIESPTQRRSGLIQRLQDASAL